MSTFCLPVSGEHLLGPDGRRRHPGLPPACRRPIPRQYGNPATQTRHAGPGACTGSSGKPPTHPKAGQGSSKGFSNAHAHGYPMHPSKPELHSQRSLTDSYITLVPKGSMTDHDSPGRHTLPSQAKPQSHSIPHSIHPDQTILNPERQSSHPGKTPGVTGCHTTDNASSAAQYGNGLPTMSTFKGGPPAQSSGASPGNQGTKTHGNQKTDTWQQRKRITDMPLRDITEEEDNIKSDEDPVDASELCAQIDTLFFSQAKSTVV